jgi:hypothetical protein
MQWDDADVLARCKFLCSLNDFLRSFHLLDWKEFHDFANVTLEVPISYNNADLQRSLELQFSNPVKSPKNRRIRYWMPFRHLNPYQL